MNLRDEHKSLTRRKVLGAVLELVSESALDEVSVPSVARRSGVSLATIYRYFPNRDALLAAAAEEPARQALAAADSRVVAGDDEFAATVRAMWHHFATNMPLLRHQLASEAGRTMRASRIDRSRQQLHRYLGGRGVDAESAIGRQLVATLLLIGGSLALVEFADRQGLSVDEAVAVTTWATNALIDAATTATATKE